jgi:hypothetical protein
MNAVAMEHWSEVIKTLAARTKLMAMDPQDFIARMERWRQSFRPAPTIRDRPQPGAIALDDHAGLHSPGSDLVHPRLPAMSRTG